LERCKSQRKVRASGGKNELKSKDLEIDQRRRNGKFTEFQNVMSKAEFGEIRLEREGCTREYRRSGVAEIYSMRKAGVRFTLNR